MNILRLFQVLLLLISAALAQSATPANQPNATPAPAEAKPIPAAAPAFPEVDADIQNNIYTNRYFGMKMQLPAGWGQQDWKGMLAAVKDRIKEQDRADVDAAGQMDDPKKGLMLLTTMPGDGSGPLMMVMTVALEAGTPAMRAEDFLMVATMPLVQKKFTISRQPEAFKVGGKDFARVELLGPDQKTIETMVFSVVKGHALGFIFVGTEAARDRAYDVLKTVSFTDVSSPSSATPTPGSPK